MAFNSGSMLNAIRRRLEQNQPKANISPFQLIPRMVFKDDPQIELIKPGQKPKGLSNPPRKPLPSRYV